MLIDAKAALCAVAESRTNAPAFHPTLCSINALLLATDALFRPVYVPSEDNPADAPSRGRRRRPTDRHVLRKPGFTKMQRSMDQLLIDKLTAEEAIKGLLDSRRLQPASVHRRAAKAGLAEARAAGTSSF